MNNLGIMTVRNNIAEVCKETGRNPLEITLVAATKSRPPELIDAAYSHGIRIAGENRAQEFRDKYPFVTVPVEWHFIGRLQANKAKYLAGRVSLVHSIESLSVLEALDSESRKKGVVTDYLVEINSGEAQKGGIPPAEALAFTQAAAGFKNVCLRGVMTVLPLTENQEKLKSLCLKTKDVYDMLKIRFGGIDYLSMGMSADYVTAIKYGSNMVRLGSAIFG